ncbi:Putative hydrolase of alpha/beta superfamily [Rheinheimera sp. A13L]|uniref:alpha/beta hydrolase n=1 Tax=Rheinheimera sp. A13L TaxID=506534 RepID=UPI0002124ACA|nr:alpha/beta hydrolase-fold protein [Rheinheimera sp. A13L]EGM76370.1 Putative hydrolase of alpha/beta superfamily [Rheinheimera sp. A13L]
MRQLILNVPLLLLMISCSDPAQQTKVSTALPQVEVLSETFVMPELNRNRQVRLYLPPGYSSSDKEYPVLYMHDGQNVFDDATAFAGEWGVDETLNELAASGQLELIVVAIDNGGEQRITELNPVDHPKYGKAEGKAYVEFIANTVKPYIDQHYRTLVDAKHTGIMGSSLGGLISHYAILQFPQVFGKAGIFSPSYWITGEQVRWFENHPAAKDARLYFYMGGKEGDSMVPDLQKVYQAVLSQGHPAELTQYHLVEDAEHNEAAWRSEFKTAVLWLFKAH